MFLIDRTYHNFCDLTLIMGSQEVAKDPVQSRVRVFREA